MPKKTRDRALDILRGFALISMTLTHAARLSSLSFVINSPIYVDAGDLFILISGFTLGMLTLPKLRTEVPGRVYLTVFQRAGSLWLLHCALMLIAVGVNEWLVDLTLPKVEVLGGARPALAAILTLRFQSDLFLNILPLFVVFFLIAPVCFEAVRRGRWYLAIGASWLLWLAAQFDPELIPWLDPRVNSPVFSLAAWQFAFVVGLVLGAQRARLARIVQARRRLWLLGAGLVFGAAFVFVRLQGHGLARLGLQLPEDAWRWAFLKQTWGPARVPYAVAELALLYAAFHWCASATSSQRAPKLLNTLLLSPLERIGKHSLTCFVAHIPLAFVSVLIALDSRPRAVQDLYAIVSLGAVYAVAWFAAAIKQPRQRE